MNRGLLLGGAALLAAAGGGWYLLAPEAEAPVAPEPGGPAPEELAAKAEAARDLELAVAAAFPEGPLASGAGATRFYGDHRLIEAPFGPVLLSRGHAPGASGGAGDAIAVHYLAPAETGFRLVRAWPEAVRIGSDDPGGWELGAQFSDLPAIRAQAGDGGCAQMVLVELTPRGPVEVARVPMLYDRGGRSFAGVVTDVRKGRGFAVRYSGTRSFVERYTRQGDHFVLDGATSRVPAC